MILDLAGMPTPASVGSVLACLDEKRSIQYVPAEYGKRLDVIRPARPSRDHFELAGNCAKGTASQETN